MKQTFEERLDEADELQDTDPGEHDDPESRFGESGSFSESQNTSAIGSARQDTKPSQVTAPFNKPPPLASSPASRSAQTRQLEAFRTGVIIALVISVPVCLMLGSLFGFLLHGLIR